MHYVPFHYCKESKCKIVQGRIEKRLKELCWSDQPYIRDQSITVEELVNQAIAQLGKDIRVRRFPRYALGEGIDKQGGNSDDELSTRGAVMRPKEPIIIPAAAQMPDE